VHTEEREEVRTQQQRLLARKRKNKKVTEKHFSPLIGQNLPNR
jgi:hypothetical protein